MTSTPETSIETASDFGSNTSIDFDAYQNSAIGFCADPRQHFFQNADPAWVKIVLEQYIEASNQVEVLKKFLFGGKLNKQPIDTSVTYANAVIPAEEDILKLHGIFGMMGETGELAQIAYANIYDQQPIESKKIKDESGDFCWYFALLLFSCDVELVEILVLNILKLSVRHKSGKFAVEDNINRDLEAESQVFDR